MCAEQQIRCDTSIDELFVDDLKILYNDWPYGLETNIIHLVIWTKFDIPEDEVTGDPTDEAREQIDKYMDETFRSRLRSEDV